MPLKYNFCNSLISAIAGWLVCNLAIILYFGFVEHFDWLLNGNIFFYLLICLIGTAIPTISSLTIVPFIIWSYNKIFKTKLFFIVWTSLVAVLWIVFSFFTYFFITGSGQHMTVFSIIKSTFSFIWLFWYFCIPISLITGLLYGTTYLLIDKNFISKPQNLKTISDKKDYGKQIN